MGKKIKITEEQLKKIIASKQVNEELYSQMDGNNTQSAVDVASESERMIDSFVNQYKDLVAGSEFETEEALLNACDVLKSKLCGNNEPVDYTMGSDDENMLPNPPSEIEMNESVIKIKSEFNRFL
jgi:hypothetical protein